MRDHWRPEGWYRLLLLFDGREVSDEGGVYLEASKAASESYVVLVTSRLPESNEGRRTLFIFLRYVRALFRSCLTAT